MKTYKILLVAVICIFLAACSSSNDTNSDCQECAYSIPSTETAGTVVASINGTHNLVFDYSQNGSQFTNGTRAKFVIDNNMLTVEIEGKECMVLKNPIQTSPFEVTFKDTCRDNLAYAVSWSQSGNINEVNLLSLSNTFYGQFK